MASIGFDEVTKLYDTGLAAVSRLTLDIADGEFIVLVGPSGCGKSTALRMIAGLEEISSGRLFIGGTLANDLSPRERNIAMVFQSYALYPHLDVGRNIAFGLKVRGANEEAIAAKVGEVAKMLELEDLLGRKPGQLSGGQRQRVAMGRALVRSPNAFLMDEPLSNLDARLRGQMRAEIAGLQKRTGVTTVYVTHDQVEAMTMGHRVAVMNAGVLQQLDTPRTLYDAPRNLFVAGFIGAPAMNFLDAVFGVEDGSAVLRLGEARLSLPADAFAPLPGGAAKRVVAGIRPEALSLAPPDRPTDGAIPGIVAFIEDLGATLLVHVDPLGATLLAPNETDRFAATRLRLRAALEGTTRIRAGDRIALRPDPAQLHLFDSDTRLSLRADRGGQA